MALLPGSRKHEIENCLPKMLAGTMQALQNCPNVQRVVVTTAPGIEPMFYQQFMAAYPTVELSSDTYATVRHAQAAVVNSGTATLETALLGCPQVAVYHLAFGHLLAFFRPVMFQIPHFTLVNIVADREVIKELLVYEFTVESVRDELSRLLTDSEHVRQIRQGYAEIEQRLGSSSASEAAAAIICTND